LGQAYERTGDYKNALIYYTHFLNHSKKQDNAQDISLALNNLAILHARQGRLKLALDHIDKSIEIEKELNSPSTLARRLANRGGILRRSNKHLKALSSFQKALELNATEESFLALVYNNMGIVYHKLGQLDNAKKYFNLSLKHNKTSHGHSRSMIYNNLAHYYREKGLYKEALEYYFKSLKIVESTANRPHIASRHNNIGSVYFAKGQFGIALEHFNQSLKLYETFQPKIGLATLHKNMALTYREQSKFDEAISHLNMAMSLVSQTRNPKDYAYILYHLAVTQSMKKNYTEALRLYEQSLAIFTSLHAIKNQADTLLSIAKIHVTATKDKQKAYVLFLKANKLFALMRNHEAQGYTYWWLGILKERDNEAEAARNFYELAYKAYTSLNRKEAHVLLGMINRVNRRLTPKPKIPTKEELEKTLRENIKAINDNAKSTKSTGPDGKAEAIDSLPEGESQKDDIDLKDIDLKKEDAIRVEMEKFHELKG
ncbi:MAG: tetratricopeptide repeat protein, partial [Spirochaetota bacterium]|nr:tetratricopeptide repeat protein [Spirochaetota bacterium]